MAVSAPSDGSIHISLGQVLTQKLVEEVLDTLPRWHSDSLHRVPWEIDLAARP